MEKVYTGNIIISTSKEAMDKIFINPKRVNTLSDLSIVLTPEEQSKTFITSQKSNSTLISFEWTYAYQGSERSVMTLKFLETNELFEMFIRKTSSGQVYYSKILEKLNKTSNAKVKSSIEGQLYTMQGELVEQEFTIYFAFGVGDNLENWAGPFVAYLSMAKMDVNSANIKEITLEFTVEPGAFNSNVVEEDFAIGLRGAINKNNRIVDYSKVIKAEGILPVNKTDDELVRIVDTTDLVSNVYKNYLDVVSNNKNSIVLIPDLIQYTYSPIITTGPLLGAPNYQGMSKFFNDLGIKFSYNINTTNTSVSNRDVANESDKVRRISSLVVDVNNKNPADTAWVKWGLPDYYKPLFNLGRGLKNLIPTFSPKFYIENDITILSILEKHGIIEDSSNVAFIFGDVALIDSYIYLKEVTTSLDLALQLKDRKPYSKITVKLSQSVVLQDLLNAKKKIKVTHSFDQSTKPFLSLQEKELDPISDAGIPIFRYNIERPNIESISVKFNSNYFDVFKFATKIIPDDNYINTSSKRLLEYAKEIIPEKLVSITLSKAAPTMNRGNVSHQVVTLFKSIVLDVDKLLHSDTEFADVIDNAVVTGNLPQDIPLSNLTILLSIIVFNTYYGISTKENPNKPYILIENSESVVFFDELLKKLDRVTYQVNIKTLPFFSLSNYTVLQKQAFLLARTSNILGTTITKKYSPITGIYSIIGFKHVITPTEMYSEFILITSDVGKEVNLFGEKANLTIKELLSSRDSAPPASNKTNKVNPTAARYSIGPMDIVRDALKK